jgi:hypothetical protein
MNSYIKILILIVIVIFIFHYKKYREYNENYQINQQELDYVNGNELYNELNPLVITFIEKMSLIDNVKKYKLYSMITVQNKNFIFNPNNNNYYKHNNELLLIRCKKPINISLINPKYQEFFKYENKSEFKEYSLDKKNYDKVTSIDIVSREYNIVYIPRHWLFKIENDNSQLEIYLSNNLFTYLFRLLN